MLEDSIYIQNNKLLKEHIFNGILSLNNYSMSSHWLQDDK